MPKSESKSFNLIERYNVLTKIVSKFVNLFFPSLSRCFLSLVHKTDQLFFLFISVLNLSIDSILRRGLIWGKIGQTVHIVLIFGALHCRGQPSCLVVTRWQSKAKRVLVRPIRLVRCRILLQTSRHCRQLLVSWSFYLSRHLLSILESLVCVLVLLRFSANDIGRFCDNISTLEKLSLLGSSQRLHNLLLLTVLLISNHIWNSCGFLRIFKM